MITVRLDQQKRKRARRNADGGEIPRIFNVFGQVPGEVLALGKFIFHPHEGVLARAELIQHRL